MRVPHLASCALGLLARQIGPDWDSVYGYRPALLETFVQADRFVGTSYRAANWVCVGSTQGRGKLDRHKLKALSVKHVFLLPLGKDWRLRLGVIRTWSTPSSGLVCAPSDRALADNAGVTR